jgi:uncharacterized protein involved in type VI secretion and phage assembly
MPGAGQVVKVQGMGTRFSGNYYVTGARHHYGARRGYTTEITVGGRRNGTMLELTGGGRGQHGHGASSAIAVGVVSANKDADGLGRVKVKLPWLGDSVETDWIRVAVPGGGKERGFYWLPEVGDEVVVAFEHGDPQRAYVVGSLWNAKAAPPLASTRVVGPEGAVNQRIIKSRSGHLITLDDTTGQEKITVADKTGSNVITIETATNKITISAQGDLELTAKANVKLSGAQVSIEALGSCEVKGAQTKVSGTVISVEAAGECAVKGGVVTLN